MNTATNTIIWPWPQEVKHEHDIYSKIVNEYHGDFSEKNIRAITGTLAWEDKVDKRAALYANYDPGRWALFEVAARHPELFDFSTNTINHLTCWSPECTASGWDREQFQAFSPDEILRAELPGPLILNFSHSPSLHYTPGAYKYVVVPTGMAELSTSSRLLYLLRYCECVVLLVNSNLQFHISARLVPWVHYVPLSDMGMELASKVRWLQQNDDLARQIATNAHNFALSYLRLEDTLCYAANTVQAVGEVQEGTSVLEPFNPQLSLPHE
jgi:hypothetical protein